ncbi:MAG TPA: hypothetical protein VIC51_06285, partial [Psychromonas sp.]
GMEKRLNVFFKVAKTDQIDVMWKAINSREPTGDNIEVGLECNKVDYDMVIDVSPELKGRAIILDHSGTVHRLGYPCSIEYDELQGEKDGLDEVKRQQKEKDKKEKIPKECPKCKYMKPAGQYVCAKCGYKPLNGEDVEVDESRDLEIVKGVKKSYTKQEKQEFYSELIAMKNEYKLKGKPKSERWHQAMYKQKFGVWPKGLHESSKSPTQETRNYIKSRMIAFANRKGKQ